MIGIYAICYILFPVVVLAKIKKVSGTVLLDKDDIDVIKGIATCFVMIAHMINELKISEVKISFFLDILTVIGGMGVLLFFFVSGYGIYKGYSDRKPTWKFWKRRLIKMYIPCIIIQFLFAIIDAWQLQDIEVETILLRSFLGAWFIDVILIEYMIFFVTWILSKNNKSILVGLSFVLSIIVAALFCYFNFDPRWYNGLLLFPIGMLFAWKEKSICNYIESKWFKCLLLYFIMFLVLGGGFTFGKGSLWADFLKVASGISLCMIVCIIYRKVKIDSLIMMFIGRKSLYFYLIHLGWIGIFSRIDALNVLWKIYSIIIITFIEVEILYYLYNKISKVFVKIRM